MIIFYLNESKKIFFFSINFHSFIVIKYNSNLLKQHKHAKTLIVTNATQVLLNTNVINAMQNFIKRQQINVVHVLVHA